jgi:hypothetical protein
MAWEAGDPEGAIAELRERGAIFEEYDVPGLKTVNGIVGAEGNHPTTGGAGHRSSWVKGSEGNLLAMGQAVTRALRASCGLTAGTTPNEQPAQLRAYRVRH